MVAKIDIYIYIHIYIFIHIIYIPITGWLHHGLNSEFTQHRLLTVAVQLQGLVPAPTPQEPGARPRRNLNQKKTEMFHLCIYIYVYIERM
jgi:cytochrome b561